MPAAVSLASINRTEFADAGEKPVLRALGAELESIRALGLRVEQAVCALAMNSDQIEGSAEGLQQLDRMLQQLAALRDFVGALSAGEAGFGAAAIDTALGQIRLEEVRMRLSGGAGEASSDTHAIEIFR